MDRPPGGGVNARGTSARGVGMASCGPLWHSHPSGWTIRCKVDGEWRTLLWKGLHIFERFPSAEVAATYHASLTPGRS